MVLTPSYAELNLLLQYTLAMVALDRLHEYVYTTSTGRPSPRRVFQAWIFKAPYQGISLALLILPSWLGGYSVPGSSLSGQGVEPVVRPGMAKRIGWLILDPHSGVAFSFLGSIGVCVYRAFKDYEHGTVDANQTAREFFFLSSFFFSDSSAPTID